MLILSNYQSYYWNVGFVWDSKHKSFFISNSSVFNFIQYEKFPSKINLHQSIWLKILHYLITSSSPNTSCLYFPSTIIAISVWPPLADEKRQRFTQPDVNSPMVSHHVSPILNISNPTLFISFSTMSNLPAVFRGHVHSTCLSCLSSAKN